MSQAQQHNNSTRTCVATKDAPDRVPTSKHDWVILHEEVHGTLPDAQTVERDAIVEIAQTHVEMMTEVVDIDVDLSKIRWWKATKELKTKHGYHSHESEDESGIKLSIHTLRTHGWWKILQTARHEVVHAWQHQHDAWDEGSSHKERSHGSEFEAWMDTLNITKCGYKVVDEAKYIVECPACGTTWSKHRDCKTTRSARMGSNWHECNGEKNRLHLTVDGRQVATAYTPDSKVFDVTDLTQIVGVTDELEAYLNDNGVHTLADLRQAIFNNNSDKPDYLFTVMPSDFEGGVEAHSLSQLGIETHGRSFAWMDNNPNNDGSGQDIYEHYKEQDEWEDGDPTELFGEIAFLD